MAFEVTPLTPMIGAEVSGADLGQLSGAEFAQIEQAFLDHLVLFFRDQDLSVEQHMAFGQRFGPLHIHPAANDYRKYAGLPPEILRIHADENTIWTAGDKWHTDVSCDPQPPSISILQLETVPPTGGDTLFANMYAAYEALSEPMKSMLAGLTATHDGGPNYRDRAQKAGVDVSQKTYPRASHPVIRTHPLTGRKTIYVNATFTTHIDGIPQDESDALLGFLFNHIAKPNFQCRFKWQRNSVAMWDNRCALHHAMWDYYPQVRSGRRVTVTGDRPFH
ncbi:MAG: taurine dioxygenase [Gammaproteobacteria bacterium]|nr:taurine dioxygenase [Gammaproteobacteria bacterium]